MLHLIKDAAILGAMFGIGAVVDEKTLIPIGTLVAVCSFVWWLGRKFQSIDDKLQTISKQADRMELAAIKVASLPCVAQGRVCDVVETQHAIKPLKMKNDYEH